MKNLSNEFLLPPPEVYHFYILLQLFVEMNLRFYGKIQEIISLHNKTV